MQRDFANLKQAVQNPADGPYAVGKMRELLVDLLRDYPKERYQVADLLLPFGQPIRQRSRRVIDHLIEAFETGEPAPEDILAFAGAIELMRG